MGAGLQPRFRHALTIDDRKLDEQLHGLIQDVESGYIHKLAFIIPKAMAWPLPLYELALMTARRAYDMNETVAITIITPEDAPLAVFGSVVSQAVQETLDGSGIQVISGTQAETPQPGQVSLFPQGGTLHVDRIVALPELFGRSTPGVRKSAKAIAALSRSMPTAGCPALTGCSQRATQPTSRSNTAASPLSRLTLPLRESPSWPEYRSSLGSSTLRYTECSLAEPSRSTSAHA